MSSYELLFGSRFCLERGQMAETRVELPGSHRDPLAGRETLGPADPSETAHVTVVLRRKEQVLPITPYGAPKRRDEYTAAHGADPLDIEAVRSFAKEYRLETRNDNAQLEPLS